MKTKSEELNWWITKYDEPAWWITQNGEHTWLTTHDEQHNMMNLKTAQYDKPDEQHKMMNPKNSTKDDLTWWITQYEVLTWWMTQYDEMTRRINSSYDEHDEQHKKMNLMNNATWWTEMKHTRKLMKQPHVIAELNLTSNEHLSLLFKVIVLWNYNFTCNLFFNMDIINIICTHVSYLCQ